MRYYSASKVKEDDQKTPLRKSEKFDEQNQFEGGSNINKIQLLIQKIENSILLINNSKKLTAKLKNGQISHKFEIDGLRAIENYEKVLDKVEFIMVTALQKSKDPEKSTLSRLENINYKMD